MQDHSRFESWNLHDATLKTINVDWQAKVCVITVDALLNVEREPVDCAIRWEGVSCVEVQHNSPWGESISVNQQRLESENVYVLEMQSGDEIKIRAEGVTLEW
ncbi:MAG: hypothetical protein ND866_01210 [Pyrinomonadaceae bacterium]|nr:hypothetical protein [Pyrinomonadaceae bacterium]